MLTPTSSSHNVALVDPEDADDGDPSASYTSIQTSIWDRPVISQGATLRIIGGDNTDYTTSIYRRFDNGDPSGFYAVIDSEDLDYSDPNWSYIEVDFAYAYLD